MSDLGDMFKETREATREHRRKVLAAADTEGWTKHTEWHFSRMFGNEKMQWWPSGGKCLWKGRMIYGHRNVLVLISQLKAGEK